jgi:hypothetical protein
LKSEISTSINVPLSQRGQQRRLVRGPVHGVNDRRDGSSRQQHLVVIVIIVIVVVQLSFNVVQNRVYVVVIDKVVNRQKVKFLQPVVEKRLKKSGVRILLYVVAKISGL